MCMRLVGTMGYPCAGLPACKLQLRQDSQNQDLFFFEPMDTVSAAAAASAGVSSMFFLDPEGRQIAELKKWLDLAEDEYCMGRPIRPLFINGLVKTGKSYMLKEVLPAVANTYYSSGGSGRQHAGTVLSEPNFLHVNCLVCRRGSGISGFLKEILVVLKRSAAKQQLSAAASTPAPSDNSAVTAAGAIQDFMERLPRDRLNFLLIDEAQSFYLLTRAMPGDFSPRGTTLDVEEVQLMRCIFKELLLDSPHWVAWAVTGSSMATLWANVAVTPTNGVALITYHSQLNLSPMVSKDVLEVAWEQLKAQAASWDPPLPSDLLWQSPQQIAMLAYLCQEWRGRLGTAITAAELVKQTLRGKLIPEVRDHRCNSRGSKTNFERDNRAQTDVKVGLRWFHRLLRNILCHAPILDHQKFLDAYPPEMAAFHSSGRISKVLTATYESPKPRRSGAAAAAPSVEAAAAPSTAAAAVPSMAAAAAPGVAAAVMVVAVGRVVMNSTTPTATGHKDTARHYQRSVRGAEVAGGLTDGERPRKRARGPPTAGVVESGGSGGGGGGATDAYHPQQLVKGMYDKYLGGWLSVWPRDRFLFMRTEDYKSAPVEHLTAAIKFLAGPVFTSCDTGGFCQSPNTSTSSLGSAHKH
ncbi:hypothetical protein VOLCADRAFT_107147 [Volvox carteri f. nagariensis]|uniref:Uncharacterized protein n=1 Tax=Volvox carteri f. nagariensis TaxID=3068 RepID=D8UC67_VOLCA|nr:uncharacterized protein VOLCADRAFT_107147 [Volvox carteri f. nagariensis]EFJ42641.1 hypothetical protein VOLCADRAFT_107147 [Volvox carteri f. nagariensis]|eukprot:XP_002956292.1 hypothetical protein VOLCADRAFT_107147 [Volvox carteri f. nagariensis]